MLLLLPLRVVVVVVFCGCCGGGGRGREETNRTVSQLLPSAVSLRIAETEQLYLAQRMVGGIGKVLLSIFTQTENG